MNFNLKPVDNLLEQHLHSEGEDYYSLRLFCKLTAVQPSVGKVITKSHEDLGNVSYLPQREDDYVVELEAEAKNCFENFRFSIYLTFANDKSCWKSFILKFNQLIESQTGILVSGAVYSLNDGTITLYNPNLNICDKAFSDFQV